MRRPNTQQPTPKVGQTIKARPHRTWLKCGKTPLVSTPPTTVFLAGVLLRTDAQNISDSLHGLNARISTAVSRCPSSEPMHNKGLGPETSSGFKVCDPITILGDDEQYAADINYIDLKNDDEAAVKGDHSDAPKQLLAGNTTSCLQSVAKAHHLNDKTEGHASQKYAKTGDHLLLRTLTKEDKWALGAQAAPENRVAGFKAWCRSQETHPTANVISAVQQKPMIQCPSIPLINKKQSKDTSKRDHYAPQYEMRVLNSKRKRTMSDLKYDELISPAQIESPSEKLARMAKKRRQFQKESKANTIPARVPAVQDDLASGTQDANQIGSPASTASIVIPPPALDTRTYDLSNLPEKRPIAEGRVLSYNTKSQLNRKESVVEHRTTGGKGLSAESLKRFRETGNWDRGMEAGQSAEEAQHEETEVPNIAYQYFVQKREWLETEEDALESTMGPYHTVNEANAVAKVEVQTTEIDRIEGVRCHGWSYFYQQDENGMETHMATILEIHIATAVCRGECQSICFASRVWKLMQGHPEIAPHNQRAAIPSSAFMVTPRVHVVHELQWLPASADGTMTAPSHCQLLTHGVFTLLTRANQRASTEYLETLTGNWGHSEYDLFKKMEMKSDLDKKVRAWNRGADCFHEEIKLEDGGFAKVWVESVMVEGPRN